jgi:hypothetical protein
MEAVLGWGRLQVNTRRQTPRSGGLALCGVRTILALWVCLVWQENLGFSLVLRQNLRSVLTE